jgi:hypothetical protein
MIEIDGGAFMPRIAEWVMIRSVAISLCDRMTTALRQRLQKLVSTLPEESLAQAENLLTALVPQTIQVVRTLSQQEELLISIIQKRLSQQEQHQLKFLRQRLADEVITDAEYQELLALVDPIEQLDVDRTSAMIQLAELRNVGLDVVVQEFLTEATVSHGF